MIHLHFIVFKYFRECQAKWLPLKHCHLTKCGPPCKKLGHPIGQQFVFRNLIRGFLCQFLETALV